MSRPIHPTLCSVTIAARSVSLSWSMHSAGLPNGDSSGGGEGGRGAYEALSSCALWQSLHSWPCFLLAGFHLLQVLHRNWTSRVTTRYQTTRHTTAHTSERGHSGASILISFVFFAALLTVVGMAFCSVAQRQSSDLLLQQSSSSESQPSNLNTQCTTHMRICLQRLTIARALQRAGEAANE